MQATQAVKQDAMSFSTREQIVRAGRALRALAKDPTELERVFEIGEALNAKRIPRLLEKLERDPEVKRLFDERPRIDTRHVDFEWLASLPDGTLGREYVRFMRTHGIDPDVFPTPNVADERVAYIMTRIRQTHDIWHVLTGYAPDLEGEIVLQAFSFAQIRSPLNVALVVVGVIRHGYKVPGLLRKVAEAYRRGKRTRRLASFYWEEHWTDSLVELREALGLPPALA
jgi:ubiquinone biosynthesis protein Coq4